MLAGLQKRARSIAAAFPGTLRVLARLLVPHRMLKLRVIRLALASACCAALLCAGSQTARSRPEAKEAELKQVRGRIESIRRSIHAEAERRDALSTQLQER